MFSYCLLTRQCQITVNNCMESSVWVRCFEVPKHRFGTSPYSHWTGHGLGWLHCPSCKMLLAAYPGSREVCQTDSLAQHHAQWGFLASNRQSGQCSPIGARGSEHRPLWPQMGPEQLVTVPWGQGWAGRVPGRENPQPGSMPQLQSSASRHWWFVTLSSLHPSAITMSGEAILQSFSVEFPYLNRCYWEVKDTFFKPCGLNL